MSAEVNKIIYSMVGVSKFYNNKPILKDIYLSYFYGAKIGVIGLNGSGKSSLLKILAGVDKNINGETVVSPGFTIGYLEQEPHVDETKTVREIVQEGVQSIVDLLTLSPLKNPTKQSQLLITSVLRNAGFSVLFVFCAIYKVLLFNKV